MSEMIGFLDLTLLYTPPKKKKDLSVYIAISPIIYDIISHMSFDLIQTKKDIEKCFLIRVFQLSVLIFSRL